jgi:hypothetical protein
MTTPPKSGHHGTCAYTFKRRCSRKGVPLELEMETPDAVILHHTGVHCATAHV